MGIQLDLQLLDGEYAVTLLPPSNQPPEWVPGPGLVNITHCDDELSIVTLRNRVPARLDTDAGWRAIKLTSSFDFDQPGIVLSVVQPLSNAGQAVFVISTYHRDYLLVRERYLDRSILLLESAGHQVTPPEDRRRKAS